MTARLSRSAAWIAAVLGVVACLAAVAYYSRHAPAQHPTQPAIRNPQSAIRNPVYPPVTGERFERANVVVITIDTLRRDYLAPYRAAFATNAATRLAREGAVFEHAVSQVPLTLPSHASIFTGLYPPHHAVRDNGFVLDPGVTTLAERLQASGYATAGFVSSYVLHSRWGIAQGHDVYDDSFDYRGLENRSLVDVERPAGAVIEAALAWLRGSKRGSRPFYLWVHLYDPHEPYAPPEAFKRQAPNPYAGEVIYADHEAGRLLDALDAMRLRSNTLVVYRIRSRRVARRPRRADARRVPLWRDSGCAADHCAPVREVDRVAGAGACRSPRARARTSGGRYADRARSHRRAGAAGPGRRQPASDDRSRDLDHRWACGQRDAAGLRRRE